MIHEELSREIIGAAMAVLNELKPGLDDRIPRHYATGTCDLINFKNARLEWKRVLRPQQTEEGAKPDLQA
jgi:hypothetical protein